MVEINFNFCDVLSSTDVGGCEIAHTNLREALWRRESVFYIFIFLYFYIFIFLYFLYFYIFYIFYIFYNYSNTCRLEDPRRFVRDRRCF